MSTFFLRLYYLLIVVAFALYEDAEMTRITLVKLKMETDVLPLRYRVCFFLLCGGLFFFVSRPKIPLYKVFSYYTLYLLAVSVIFDVLSHSVPSALILSVSILLPLVTFNCFYWLSEKLDERTVMIGLIISSIIMFLSFLSSYETQMLYTLSDETRTNSFYIFLFIAPLFLLSKSNIIRIGSLLFVAGVMIFSLKRGGAIALGLSVLSYFLVLKHCSNRRVNLKIIFIVLFFFICSIIIVQELQSYIDSLSYRLSSLSEDEGSDRVSVYSVTWGMIANSNIISVLVGHGWNMVLNNSPMQMSAHNDLLEVLYDFGIFGISMYILFVYRLFTQLINMIRKRSPYAAPFAFSVISFSVISSIAHVIIYPFYFIVFTMVWGYILSKERKYRLISQTI